MFSWFTTFSCVKSPITSNHNFFLMNNDVLCRHFEKQNTLENHKTFFYNHQLEKYSSKCDFRINLFISFTGILSTLIFINSTKVAYLISYYVAPLLLKALIIKIIAPCIYYLTCYFNIYKIYQFLNRRRRETNANKWTEVETHIFPKRSISK